MNKNQFRRPLINGLLLIVCSVVLLSCSKNDSTGSEQLHFSDREWEATKLFLIYSYLIPGWRYADSINRKLPNRVDMFHVLGNRFALVHSQRNDSVALYGITLGIHSGLEITTRPFPGSAGFLYDDSVAIYQTLVKSDSVWKLFAQTEFWSSKESWDKLEEYIFARKENSKAMTDALYFHPTFMAALNKNPDRWEKTRLFARDISLVFAFKYNDSLGTLIDDKYTISTVDYKMLNEDWFSVIMCRRDNVSGAYLTVVGYVEDKTLNYVVVNDSIQTMEGTELDRYIHLLISDSLWTMIDPGEELNTSSSLSALYDSIVASDSTTLGAQKHEIHLDSLFVEK